MTTDSNKKKRVRRWGKIPGLVGAARELGVTHGHLYGVVVAKDRTSRRLTARYEEWKAAHPEIPAL